MNSWQRFFSYSVGSLFSLVTISFAVQKLFSLMQSHLFIFFLLAEPLEFYLGSHSLCLYVPVYILLLPVIVSNFRAYIEPYINIGTGWTFLLQAGVVVWEYTKICKKLRNLDQEILDPLQHNDVTFTKKNSVCEAFIKGHKTWYINTSMRHSKSSLLDQIEARLLWAPFSTSVFFSFFSLFFFFFDGTEVWTQSFLFEKQMLYSKPHLQ
jgi:hypothetical protein